ncbi:MFS transporter [Tundrisphaera sp. TA3]|uniref:MFS transporter n=1 Tax=Tundrisphaera sp. TA3 TaxID=3435775 RepID=UPI003EBF78C2
MLPAPPPGDRSATWRWYICVLLLLATVVNYMDRLTANTLAVEIQAEFKLNDEQYGNLELGFGLAFAFGSILFGWLVDKVGVFWLYPVALVGWSAMGYLTGLSRSYGELMFLRIMLGLFEAGHFPCGLKTVQVLLPARDRALGNSLLQSGTALGAILAPQAIRLLIEEGTGGWRKPFLVIGAGGTAWVVLWFLSIRPRDLRDPVDVATTPDDALAGDPVEEPKKEPSFWSFMFSKRFLALAIMVICINLNWHLFRVWLPKFLRESRGYGRDEMLNFTTFYYIAADLGAIGTGFLAGRLARNGWTVFASRMAIFAGCCALTTLTTAAAFMPRGPWLLAALLLVAFGGLGAFSAFYSMTQDLSRKHQGKISGTLSTTTWLVSASLHPVIGRYLDRTHDYDLVVGLSGWFPVIGLIAVLALWGRDTVKDTA